MEAQKPVPDGASSEFAPAKINLALHVIGKRPDGYHLIESLVVFADYGDVVTAEPSPDGRAGLTATGPSASALSGTRLDDNLALRAARELIGLRAAETASVRLTLDKRIPVSAGLGGGSTDAAATLRLLNRVWQLGLAPERLAEIGLRLGADVPMCLASRPAVVKGLGEGITAVVGFPALPMVLAHPGVAISTAAVFAHLAERARTPLPRMPDKFGSLFDTVAWLRQTRNDLGEPAMAVNEEACAAAKALQRDANCLFARMTGSGAAGFGIFPTIEAAEEAARRLGADKPGWWVTATMTAAA